MTFGGGCKILGAVYFTVGLGANNLKLISTKISKDLPQLISGHLVAVFNDACASSMHGRGIHRWLTAAVFFLVVGCASTPPIAFQNNSHRQTYSLDLQDLEKLQFYISRDVVAQYQDATGTKSLLVPRLTPGVATSAGPNWIKVSFREGGVDVPFIADPKEYDGRYWIATEVEGTKEFRKIMDLPDKTFLYKGVRYKLVSGSEAILLVDWEGWKKVVETRKVTEGRRAGEK